MRIDSQWIIFLAMQTQNIFPRENWKHGWKTRNAVSESGCVCRVLGVLFEDIWGWCRPKHLSPHKSFKSSPMPGKGVSTRRRRNVSLFSDGQVLKTDGIKKKKERKKGEKSDGVFAPHTLHYLAYFCALIFSSRCARIFSQPVRINV